MKRRDFTARLYGALLRLYPRDFREHYEAELWQAFDHRRTEARFRGTLGGIRLVGFLLRDFLISWPLTRDRTTKGWGIGEMTFDVFRDLRFSARMLRKNPVFTFAAVTTLALGIGLNAATFSAVHSMLLRPLPGAEDTQELVQIYREWNGIEFGSNSIPHFQDVRDRSGGTFESMAAWYFSPMSISADGQAERTMGVIVSAGFFQTYGVRPFLGRVFIPGVEDRDPGAHPVAVIGHGLWQERFASDREVIGRTVILNGVQFEIVGVAPPDFQGPVAVADVPIYVPLMMQYTLDPSFNRITARGNNMMSVVGRLAEGRTIEQAEAHMDAVLTQLREEYPNQYENQIGTTLVPQNRAGIHPSFAAAQTMMSTLMMVVVGLLLLIACVNVANLFLARARDRSHEMGVRVSIGASRGRIIRQLLTESLLFSVLAGALGILLARVALSLLSGVRPPIDGPFDVPFEVDSTVLLFTVAISLAAGVVFGMAPALQAARPSTVSAIKREAGNKAGRSRASSALVVAQMAMSLLLLMSSGLFLRSLQGANQIDPGFTAPENLVVAAADPGLQGYEEAQSRQFWDRILEEVGALPEIQSVALAWSLPLGLTSSDRGVEIPGYEFTEGELSSLPYSYPSEGYFETMGTEVIEGRTFGRSDDAEAPPSIVVNQRIAERFWPGESAIGKIVETAGEAREVIGVVETGKYRSLGEDPMEFMWIPFRESFQSDMTIVARTSGDPALALQSIQRIIRSIDPDMPIYDVRTMEDHMGIALLPARLAGSVLGIFGLLGLTLAAVGIYGVMAYSVSQRRRELGIRVAMGADRASVLKLVLGEGMRLTLLGTVIGIISAAGAARLVQSMLYGVSALDPLSFTGVPALLLMVAAFAIYIPARRAAWVDPIKVLKSD